MKKKDNTETDKDMKRKPVRRCQADVGKGLSQEQVRKYAEAGWTNAAVDSPSKTVPEIIKGNLFTYFNLVFAVLAVLVMLAGSLRSLTFLPVVLINLVIGIVQEIRAKRTLDKLSMLNVPKAVVIRDGVRQEVPAGELVLDDIVSFQAGNQICADAVVLKGEVSVNESLLTGESDEVLKRPGDLLMSGSFVASGNCYARLENVGEDSYISGLTLEAKAMKTGEQSEMLRILDRLVGVMGILIIPIGIALFAQHFFFLGIPFDESIVFMVAAVVGMIPEGLYLLASVALVVSVMRLASKKVLVHDMKCIETLARVDVLCVDKTGTITENAMEVSGVVSMGAAPMEGAIKKLLSEFVAAMPDENATMKALKRYFNMPPVRKAEAVVPFSSAYKYSGAVFDGKLYVLGAPEFVLREDYEVFRERVEGYANRLAKDPRTWKVFSSKVHGDPATPVWKAYPGDRVIFRTMMPADKPRNTSIAVHDHLWREQQRDPLSRIIPLQGGVSIGNKFDMELLDGAGCPGDYLYRSGSFAWDVESGMWGIFRVVKRTIGCRCKGIYRKIRGCLM